MVGSSVGKVSNDKLIMDGSALAYHANNLRRIHWPESHSAHGVRVRHPIGYDVDRPPFGQGVCNLPIWQSLQVSPIGLWLREPPICTCCKRPWYHRCHPCLRYRIGIQRRTHGVGAAMSPLRLSMRAGAGIRREDIKGAISLSFTNLIITFVLITPFILWF